MSLHIYYFLDCHGRGCSFAAVIVEAAFFLIIACGPYAEPDLLFRLAHFDDLEIELFSDRKRWFILGAYGTISILAATSGSRNL
jgi:hypothetical protein